jgi:hypothetical protein
MRFMHSVAVCVLAVAVPSVGHAKDKAPEMSTLELQAIQSHDFEAHKEDVFGAVMTVLQDAGYRIQAGDIQTGLITGVGSTESKLSYNFFWGFGKKKQTPMVSVFIEKMGVGSRVRLNFVMAKLKSNVYGAQPEDETPVTEAAVYKDAFEKIEQALFVRQAMNTATPAPPVATGAANPTPTSPSPIPEQNAPKPAGN